jgi:hypothetical protein
MTLKNWMFVLLGVIVVGLASCSKETVDNMGRDTALNIIRTGNWERWTKTVSGSPTVELNVTREMMEQGESLNFDKDGAWHKKKDNTAVSYDYSMPDSKTMIFDGVEYQIQENIVSSISKLTLINQNGGVKTTMVFKRSW